MTNRARWLGTRLGVFLTALALGVTTAGATANAAPAEPSGHSTPGVTVVAVNPASAAAQSFRLALTAHTERTNSVSDPSCRPQDLTLHCWGSLSLQVPARGGLLLTRFEVHRVAVGDGGGCGGHDDGGCEDDHGDLRTSAASSVKAHVNGVATLTDPGDTGLPAGSLAQVKITLTDNGAAPNADLAEIEIREFTPGPVKPLLYESGPHVVQQVQVRVRDGGT